MQRFLILIPIPDNDPAAGIKIADTFFNHQFLFIFLQVMQHICQDDGIVFFKFKTHHIAMHKINVIGFAETMICSINFFFVIIYTRNLSL